MNDACEGIVLGNRDYKDADAIVTVLSKDYGKLTFSARGIRKMKSKNANGCNLFNKSMFYFNYQSQRGMQSLKTAEGVNSYRHIRENLTKQAIASVMVEMMDKLSIDDASECYHILDQCLLYLEATTNLMALFGLYVAQCLQLTGITPNVEGCVSCGRTDELVSISLARGGFVCEQCFDPTYEKKYALSILKFFRLLNKADLTQFSLIEEITPCTYEAVEPLLDFFKEYSGIGLQSLKFLQTVIAIDKA